MLVAEEKLVRLKESSYLSQSNKIELGIQHIAQSMFIKSGLEQLEETDEVHLKYANQTAYKTKLVLKSEDKKKTLASIDIGIIVDEWDEGLKELSYITMLKSYSIRKYKDELEEMINNFLYETLVFNFINYNDIYEKTTPEKILVTVKFNRKNYIYVDIKEFEDKDELKVFNVDNKAQKILMYNGALYQEISSEDFRKLLTDANFNPKHHDETFTIYQYEGKKYIKFATR